MWFKLAFGVVFFVAVTVAARTARKAVREHGGALNQLAHEVRGLVMLRAALGLVFYAALAAWLVSPQSLPWAYLPIPTSVRILATALLIPVLWLYVASFTAIGTNYRGGVGLYSNHGLVTSGPYRHIRHPIYASFVALMCLVLVLSANWVLGLSGLLLVGSIAAARIPVEERQLSERFGDTWSVYKGKTGMMVPTISR